MDTTFWHERWAKNEIAFHNKEANPFLVKYFAKLALLKGRIFVPLCGKTLDIHWMLSQGYSVAGAELSPVAIEQLFNELGVKPKIEPLGTLIHYSAPNIDIFVGNIFDLSNEILGPIDAIYDRAALVALPQNMRATYTAHLIKITTNAPQLLICYEYDQSKADGPPFSISSIEVNEHYKNSYTVTHVESETVVGGLKGKCEATENVWLLIKGH